MDYTEVMASINEYNSKMGDNLYQELSDGTLKLKPQFAQMYNDIKELMNAGFSVPVKFNMINTPFTSGFSSSINAPSIFAPRIRSFSGGADIGTPDVAPIGDGLNLGGLVRSAREMTSVANATGGSAVSSGLTINQGVVSEPKQDNTLPTDVKVVVESTPITITLDGNVLAREIIPKVERYQDLKYRNARRGGGL